MSDNMPSLRERIREIPIFRESDERQPHLTSRRTASPANCPSTREIPIQRDTGIGHRPFGDFFNRQEQGWGDPWSDHRGPLNSDMFDNDPFSGFPSRPGFPSFPSHIRGDRRSPVPKPYSRQSDDGSLPHHSDSPVTISQQPVAADATVVPPPDQPRHTVPIFVDPAESAATQAGYPGFPSRVRNDFGSERRSPVPKSFPKHSDDGSLPHHVEPPVAISRAPQQPVVAEAIPVPPSDQPKHTAPTVVKPAESDTAAPANKAEAKSDTIDGSLHVEEPPRRPRSPSPAPPNMTPLEIIEQIMAEAGRLKEEVEVYSGGRKEKAYLRLEELLTRLMLKLDRIESEGRDDIRNARREAVHTIQSILELLESQTSKTAAKENAQWSALSENPCTDPATVSDATSCTDDSQGDGEQTKKNVDAAAVKEMVLGSEVPC